MRRIAILLATLGVLLVSVFGASAGCGLTNPCMEPKEVAKAVAPKIDEASVREHLEHLTGVSPVSLEGGKKTTISERGSEEGRRAAAEYMKESFEEAGVPARILEFTSGSDRGYNVEATLKGTEGEKHLWVTAHMDSVGNAGANDNASGLVMLLLTARALEQLELEHTVHFVAYDLEEVGLVGSIRYVYTEVASVRDQEGEEAIIGNINADMVGYEENEFSAVVSRCKPTGILDDALMRASDTVHPSVALDELCSDRIREDSDHAPFMDSGFPAVAVTDSSIFDGYPCYHKPSDTADKVNVAYLRSMIRTVATASALLAVPEPGQAAS
jgi:Iap family predicted aminopeptidase